ncbi:type I methionyl aminopeptidase [Patulibacter sp. SYSU D01012]|uniref:type I methionyl aminopeptidase n=1 Tax=Patulibacter sp. SYSU D01012 TaxID=2817381 RepID=UPI001B304C4C|nr:type I methionyl aminopeptidase [Patulibacter sp. SYSU D01012]
MSRPPLTPGPLSPRRKVPREIPRPPYALLGEPPAPKAPRARTAQELASMREACAIASDALAAAAAAVAPGVTTDEIDAAAHEVMVSRGAYPSTLNYRGYPKSTCISINEVICHGIPDLQTTLYEGDIVTIDVTAYFEGMHGDLNQTFAVGEVDQASKDLMEATRRALDVGIQAIRPGGQVRDIGKAIEKAVRNRFGIVHQFGGHGIGPDFHDGLHVQHVYDRRATTRFFPGMTLTVEPMLTLGRPEAQVWEADGWTAVTVDGSRCAQEEHTVLVTEDGVEVLTRHVPH